ncbi:MAG: hypothetical protein ABW219_14080 [Ilumatobacteraceae bacterium]
MSTVVCVHGAFHELWGPHQIAGRWVPALRDGLTLAGTDVDPDEVAVVFYGDLFRSAPGAAPSDDDLRAIAERTGLLDAAREVAGPDGLQALVEHIGREQIRRTVGQLGRYFDEPALRETVRARVRAAIGPDTRVVVAHSLGTVAAYEALVDHDSVAALDLVTFGSPLARPRLIDADLEPPLVDGRGAWPGAVRTWTNITSIGDMVADGFPLAPVFGAVVEARVDNGHRAHEPEPYLCAQVTGAAIAAALRS